MNCKDNSNRGIECFNEAELLCAKCNIPLCSRHIVNHYDHDAIQVIDRNERLDKIKLQVMSIKMQTLLSIEETTLKIKNDLIKEIEDLMTAQNYILEQIEFYSTFLVNLPKNHQTIDSPLEDFKSSFNRRFKYKSSRKIVEIGLLFLQQLHSIEKILHLSKDKPFNNYLPAKEVIGERLITNYPFIFDLNEFEYSRKFTLIDLNKTLFIGVIETLVNFMDTTEEFENFNKLLFSAKYPILPNLLLSIVSLDNIPECLITWINDCCNIFLEQNPKSKKPFEILKEFSQIFNIQIYYKYESYKKILDIKRNDCSLKLFIVQDEKSFKLFIPKKQNYFTLSWKYQIKDN